MEIEDNSSNRIQTEIKSLLDEFNQEKVGDDNHELITLSISESDELVAGLVGGTYWGYMYVDSLIVVKNRRNCGLGRALILRAEQIALSKGCEHATIDTHDFQGFEFYLKLDYKIIGKLPDLPQGNFKYHLYKKLK